MRNKESIDMVKERKFIIKQMNDDLEMFYNEFINTDFSVYEEFYNELYNKNILGVKE